MIIDAAALIFSNIHRDVTFSFPPIIIPPLSDFGYKFLDALDGIEIRVNWLQDGF